MDWDCWNRAFTAMYGDPLDAKRKLKDFHHRIIATSFVLVSHEAAVRGPREIVAYIEIPRTASR